MMKNHKILLSSLLLLTFISTSAFSPAQTTNPPQPAVPNINVTQVDTSEFPKVTVYVSVTDQAGEPIVVNSSSLILKEDGKEITPDQVLGKGESGQLTTILAIDVSGSMNTADKLKIAKSVAKSYIEQMRPDDQAGIISFNVTNRVVQTVTSDKNLLASAIESLQAGGDTAMYDALAVAINVVNPLSGRKAIITLTDGMDNSSKQSSNEVIKTIGEKGLSISTVGFGEPNQSTASLSGLDERILKSIANQTGGQYGYANDQTSLQQIYEKYSRTLQSEYEITYTSPSKLRDGLSRGLTVTLADGSTTGALNSIQTSYNPGGLVPEVASAAPWSLFFGLLVGLVLLLLVPFGLEYLQRFTPQKSRIKLSPAPTGKRIKLK